MEQKKYPNTVAGLWTSKTGGFHSMPVDETVFETLKSLKPGDRLTVKTIDDKYRSHDRMPNARLEIWRKEDQNKAATPKREDDVI